ARVRSHEHDASTPSLALHLAEGCPRGVDHARELRRERLLDEIVGELEEALVARCRADGMDICIQPAEAVDNIGKDPITLLGVGDVGLKEDHTVLAELLHHGIEPGAVGAILESEASASLTEQLRGGQADATGRARDQDHGCLACDVVHAASLLFAVTESPSPCCAPSIRRK